MDRGGGRGNDVIEQDGHVGAAVTRNERRGGLAKSEVLHIIANAEAIVQEDDMKNTKGVEL